MTAMESTSKTTVESHDKQRAGVRVVSVWTSFPGKQQMQRPFNIFAQCISRGVASVETGRPSL
jgi:hypothetical protein